MLSRINFRRGPAAAQSATSVGQRAATAGTDVFSSGVTGDTNDRFVVNADGKLEWGPGNAGLDVDLYRSAANQLRTSDNFLADQDIVARWTAAEQVYLGAAGPAAQAGITFGSAADTNLYRSAANTLKTDDALTVTGQLTALGAVQASSLHTDFSITSDSVVRAVYGTASEVQIGGISGSGIGIAKGSLAGASNAIIQLFLGSGAPNNANGANGDVYIRQDGGALTTIYQRRAGAWAGVA